MNPIPASTLGFVARQRPLFAALLVLTFCAAAWVGVAYAAYSLIV